MVVELPAPANTSSCLRAVLVDKSAIPVPVDVGEDEGAETRKAAVGEGRARAQIAVEELFIFPSPSARARPVEPHRLREGPKSHEDA
jgi:hypothetical protein